MPWHAEVVHRRVVIVGGGMITHDQILPSLYHLQRLGAVGPIPICALNSGAACGRWPNRRASPRPFPGQTFEPLPPLDEPPERMFPDLYKEAIAALPPRQPGGGGRARPFPLPGDPRRPGARPARADGQAAGAEVRPGGRDREAGPRQGLLVGVEYHKRFDRRSLDARGLLPRAAASASSAAARPS